MDTSGNPRIGLLQWRMTLLNLDPDELRGANPQLFCELQGKCSLCQSPDRCAAELAHAAWQDWREYCPNQAILTMPKREFLVNWGKRMTKTGRKRRTWTAEHVGTLKRLARRKTPAAKIAKVLKRTENATRQKAFSLGLSLETRSRNMLPKTLSEALGDGHHQAEACAVAK